MPVFSLAPKSKPVVKPAILSDNAARILSPDIARIFKVVEGLSTFLESVRISAAKRSVQAVSRLRSLEQWICELLSKNQQLRTCCTVSGMNSTVVDGKA